MIRLVISGGQSGYDKMGLRIARELNIPTGGTAPLKYWTENGSDFELRDIYGLQESPYLGYVARTVRNVVDSDGTVLFGNMQSYGSQSTINHCEKLKRPYIINPLSNELAKWITDNNIEVLNVAGNRGSKVKSGDLKLNSLILSDALMIVNKIPFI